MISLFLTFLLSLIGTGYLIYAKKQKSIISMVCGLALCISPYFIDNWLLLVLAGAVLMIVPFKVRF